MIFMTIIGSILLFPAGNLRYIDALFFAAGSATQSGLNTVDVNKLNLYQQVGGSISFEGHSIQGMRAAGIKNHWVHAFAVRITSTETRILGQFFFHNCWPTL